MTTRQTGIALLASCALAFASTQGALSEAQNWDPPAITVHPDHNRAARDPALIPELIEQGRLLFSAKFNEADGAGRPAATGDSKPTPRDRRNDAGLVRTAGPDALSCAGCHNEPILGGSGDFPANVFVGAHFRDPVEYRIDAAATNERNTTSIRGAGLIELLAKEMTREMQGMRESAIDRARRSARPITVALTAKGVSFGEITAHPDGTVDTERLAGVDPDIVVRPFGVKGIAVSLREFTIAALNQHHGIQAVERFGWERTGRRDFDEDGVEEEMTIGQLTALVVFQAQLPSPRRESARNDAVLLARERRGEELFAQVGCTSCHIPALPLKSFVFREPNEYNRPGTLRPEAPVATVDLDLSSRAEGGGLVNAYTDLKRHNLCDDDITLFCNERFKQDNIDTRLFLTAKLWDLATSAPYGHRGDLRTISGTILAHGGEARAQREAFLRLPDSDKRALIDFLRSLGRAWSVDNITPVLSGGRPGRSF